MLLLVWTGVWASVQAGHGHPVDVPEVEPGPGAGDDVPGEGVDADGGHGPRVPRQLLDVGPPAEVPDDGRGVPRPGHRHPPARVRRQAGHRVRVAVQLNTEILDTGRINFCTK